jgi:hypothetical protein
MLVKHQLYAEKYTIEGARQRIEQFRRSGELKVQATRAASRTTLRELREQLDDVIALLDGRAPEERE